MPFFLSVLSVLTNSGLAVRYGRTVRCKAWSSSISNNDERQEPRDIHKNNITIYPIEEIVIVVGTHHVPLAKVNTQYPLPCVNEILYFYSFEFDHFLPTNRKKNQKKHKRKKWEFYGNAVAVSMCLSVSLSLSFSCIFVRTHATVSVALGHMQSIVMAAFCANMTPSVYASVYTIPITFYYLYCWFRWFRWVRRIRWKMKSKIENVTNSSGLSCTATFVMNAHHSFIHFDNKFFVLWSLRHKWNTVMKPPPSPMTIATTVSSKYTSADTRHSNTHGRARKHSHRFRGS